jgi:crossover junction endodeoxyribonuclease RuvC
VRILGVDPGLRITGFACVVYRDGLGRPDLWGTPSLADAGCIRLAPKRPVAERLAELETELVAVIADANPDAAAVESLFSHYAHPRTAIIMAHARGVILLTLQRAGVRFLELPPREIKKAIVGFGGARKAQVQQAVTGALSLTQVPEPPDIADAMAIALTAGERLRRESALAGT